jgi:hypothetical protein
MTFSEQPSFSVLGFGAGGLSPGLPGLAACYKTHGPWRLNRLWGSYPLYVCHVGDLAIEHRHTRSTVDVEVNTVLT